MAIFEMPSSMKRRISSSWPSSREAPSEPFGRPSFRPEALARARPSRMRSEIRSRSTSANSANNVVMTFVWMSRLPSTRMFSFSATKATPALARASRIVTIWTQRPTEPRELADDQAVAAAAGRSTNVRRAPRSPEPRQRDGGLRSPQNRRHRPDVEPPAVRIRSRHRQPAGRATWPEELRLFGTGAPPRS